MSLNTTQHYFTKLYLAVFLRAPDLGGLNYWTDEVLVHGKSLPSIGGIIFSLPVVTNTYPASLSDLDFVEAIYHNVFGRDSDAQGLAYWASEIATLRSTYTAQGSANADFEARAQLVMNMMNAGLGTPDGTDGKAYIENRLAVAEYVAEQQLELGRDISAAFLLETLSHVNADDASVSTGKNAITNLLADETAPNLLTLGLTTSVQTSGVLAIDIPGHSSFYGPVIQDAEGHLLVFGINSETLTRLNADATLDTSFGGGDGVVNGFGSLFLLQSDNKLVGHVVGSDLSRLNPDGTLDNSFGNAGHVTTHFPGEHGHGAHDLIQQQDGKLVTAGYEYSTRQGPWIGDLGPQIISTYYGFSLVRYNMDGSLDTSFGGNGRITTDFVTGYDSKNNETMDLIQQADGKLVVAGTSNKGFELARYNPDGSLDSGFGSNGLVTTDFAQRDDGSESLFQLDDGKLMLVGRTNNTSNFVIARYNPDGSLDSSFANHGLLTTDFAGGGGKFFQLADGKLLFTGITNEHGQYEGAMVRHNADGSLDISFGNGGRVDTGSGIVGNLLSQPDGSLLVSGYDGSALARLNPDGSLDTHFGGGDGKASNEVAHEFWQLIQQNDGQLLLTSWVVAPDFYTNNLLLARYNPDGTPDTGFGSDQLLAALSLSSDEDATAGLYDGSNTLIDAALVLSANTAATLEVSAQASVTQTSLRLTDDAGNSSSGPAVILGTTENDILSLSSAGYLFGFDGGDDLIGSSGADVFIGGKGEDRLWLGSDSAVDQVFFGVEGLNYHDYPMDYDVIYDMALGSGGDVLDLSSLNLGAMSLNATIFNTNPSVSTNISGQVVRLLDQTSYYPDGFLPRPSDTELMQALNDGRYANLDMDANSSALILVNWVIDQHAYNNTTFLSRVESNDTGEIDSVELIGVIRNVDVNLWTADNFTF
jgi:uncharacterized delta-60 repeat protein